MWPVILGAVVGLAVVFFAPVQWWGIVHGKPIPTDWDAIPKHKGMEYRAYLTTDAWQLRRRYLIGQADHRCRLCNGSGILQLHHRTYARVGDERPDDLIVLCKACHDVFHQQRAVTR